MKRAVVLAFFLVAEGAYAQNEAEATRLYGEGQRLMNDGQLREACVKFEGSLKAGGGIGTMLYLGACYERTARPSSAYAMYTGALSMARTKHDQREGTAADLAAKIKPRVSWLTLTFTSPRPVSYELRRDGSIVANDELDSPIPTDPGEHTIDTRAPGKTPWQTKISVDAEGLTVKLAVPDLVDAPKPKPIVLTQTKTSGSTQRVIGASIAGVGVVSLVVGAVFGVMVIEKQNASTTPGSGSYCDDAAVPPYCEDGGAARADAMTMAHVADVTLIVGAAALIGGVIVFLTAPKAKLTPSAGGAAFSISF